MPVQEKHFYEFGPFRIDTAERRLLRGEETVPLTPKVYETLLVLVENAGRGMEKDQLLQRIWPDAFVEENSLTRNIYVLRKALGDEDGRYIETLPKRGYRFVAPIAKLHPFAENGAAERPAQPKRIPWVFYAAAAGLAVSLAAVGFLYHHASVAAEARSRIPEVERLFAAGNPFAAFDLLARLEKLVPDDPRLPMLDGDIVLNASVQTDPPGANVYFRDYSEAATPWRYLGKSPLARIGVPYGPLRWKLEKAGHVPTYMSSLGGDRLVFTLLRTVETPPEMVNVPPRTGSLQIAGFDEGPVPNAGQFQMDRYETTNKQFQAFVNAGGYQNKQFWKHPFRKGSRTIAWDEAMREFVDTTGRPGPATWEAGSYSPGKEDFPVSGVSWYEAAAYAEFAGKSLPTIYHWYRAADLYSAFHIVRWSNFGTAGPARVGEYKGEGPYGTFDMAGNVQEWCWNETDEGMRFILGGSWKDPSYQFSHPDARSPFDRSDSNGFRLIRYLGPAKEALTKPISIALPDYSRETPVGDAVFQAYRSDYAFDAKPLNAVVESEEDNIHWKTVRIVIDAAYGSEKLPLYLLLPKTGKAPYQVVLLHPGKDAATWEDSRKGLLIRNIEYVVRSGRAAILPILSGTYERRNSRLEGSPLEQREEAVRRYQDIVRTLDYVQTRPDIDIKHVAFLGTSWGAIQSPIYLAMETRFKAAVLQSGGLGGRQRSPRRLPENDPFQFAPRVRLPVLMVNGRFDFTFPVESSQRPLFRLLGTAESNKRYILLDTAHEVLSRRSELMRAVLDWLDRYLGPVQ